MPGRPRSLTDLDRFTEKYVVAPDGCWLWTSTTARGYATFCVDAHKVRAARWAYEHFVGPIPDGHEIDHTCHSRSATCPGGHRCAHRGCVNPAHLEAVTKTEHGYRARLAICEAGLHDLRLPENRRADVRGCYACKKDRMRRKYAERTRNGS